MTVQRRSKPVGPHVLTTSGNYEGFTMSPPGSAMIRLVRLERMTITVECSVCGLNHSVDMEVRQAVQEDRLEEVIQEATAEGIQVVCRAPCCPLLKPWHVRLLRAAVFAVLVVISLPKVILQRYRRRRKPA